MLQKTEPYTKTRGSAEWALKTHPKIRISRARKGWQITLKELPERAELPPGLAELRDQKMQNAESQQQRRELFSRPFKDKHLASRQEAIEAILSLKPNQAQLGQTLSQN